MVSLLPDQKPPEPSSLVLFMLAECDMNYSKTSGEDWFKLCSRSPETARSLLNIHHAYSGPEARSWARAVGREHADSRKPSAAASFSGAGSCCPVQTSSPGKGPQREAGHETADLTTCPRHTRPWSRRPSLRGPGGCLGLTHPWVPARHSFPCFSCIFVWGATCLPTKRPSRALAQSQGVDPGRSQPVVLTLVAP